MGPSLPCYYLTIATMDCIKFRISKQKGGNEWNRNEEHQTYLTGEKIKG